MEISVIRNWVRVSAPGRWDAFNLEFTKSKLGEVAEKHQNIGIDMSGVHFVGLPIIKYLYAMAERALQSGGRIALIGATEKLKRQIRIYASLEPFVFVKADEWEKLVNTKQEGNA